MRLKTGPWMRTKRAAGRQAAGAGLVGTLILVGGAACAQIGSSDPVTDQGRVISDLFNLELVLALLLFLLVGGLLTAIIVRFRGRPGDADPAQVTGNRKLEVTWTVLPVLVLACLFVLTVRTMNAVDAASPDELPIQVIGHQWWWEFQYRGQGIVVANELHVPVDAPLRLDLQSADVIHSFWLPQFGWMEDNIPGKTNQMRVRLNQVGDYVGACTQFCGVEHARMRLRVTVQPRDQFDAWVQQQRQPAVAPTSAAAEHGQQVFQQRTCSSCHVIQGTSALGQVGPDLTHLASRATIGAGTLDNTPDNLRRWVKNAQEVKAGALMPSFTNLSDTDLSDLASYLEGLK
jgi:cytochrome c oxidase subunit II